LQTTLVGNIKPIPLVNAGDGPTLLANKDTTNSVFLGDDAGLTIASSNLNVELTAGSFLTVDGQRDVWAISGVSGGVSVDVISGGVSFFQLSVLTAIILSNIGQGIFIYNGTPALGNLVGSWAPTAGTDKFGNVYRAGLEIQNGLLAIQDPGSIEFFSGSTTTGKIKSNNLAASLQIDAPTGVLSVTSGDLILGSNGSGRAHIYAGSDSTAVTPLAWQSVLSFSNGWSGTFKWRYGAENVIWFQCGLSPGTVADGTVITNLFGITVPVSQRHPVYCNALKVSPVSASSFEAAAFELETNGNIQIFGVGTAATQVTGVGFFPLDN
jgi:hypothetical protein